MLPGIRWVLNLKKGILDFAQCTVIHLSSGLAALASAIYLKKSNVPTRSLVTSKGLYFGEIHLFFVQLAAIVAVSIFAFGGAFILLKITDMISSFRVSEADELMGLDQSQHDEEL